MKNPSFLKAHQDIGIIDFAKVTPAALLDYYEKNKERFENTMPKVEKTFYTDAHWVSQQALHEKESLSGLAQRFCLIKGEQVIGHINYTQIFRGGFQACFLGYGIDSAQQGKNVMFFGLSKTIKIMFDEHKLHRIIANYVPDNIRSGALLMRLGFEKEGMAKSYLKLNGQWKDHILTSLVNTNE